MITSERGRIMTTKNDRIEMVLNGMDVVNYTNNLICSFEGKLNDFNAYASKWLKDIHGINEILDELNYLIKNYSNNLSGKRVKTIKQLIKYLNSPIDMFEIVQCLNDYRAGSLHLNMGQIVLIAELLTKKRIISYDYFENMAKNVAFKNIDLNVVFQYILNNCNFTSVQFDTELTLFIKMV